VIDGSLIYFPEYPYRSGLSEPLVEYQRTLATDIVSRCAVPPGSLCVDIGSNDGTLLSHLKGLGYRTLGIEPTNIAAIAEAENGIETIQRFFTTELGREIARDYGRAHVVTMTNVFAHMSQLGDVLRGICELLRDDGVFVTESHYLLDVLERNQFDTIYHEHLRTYSVKALVRLFPYYGLELFHVERATRYGGNIRAFVARRGTREVTPSVAAHLEHEEVIGLHQPGTWAAFRTRVDDIRDRFMEFMYTTHRRGERVAGYSCPGRATPLLNYFGIDAGTLPYIGELPDSLKLNKFVPGVHVPIVSSDRLRDEQPDYVIVFAWHYADAIRARLRREGVTSRIVTILPDIAIDGQRSLP
jgi:hypothetical protein